MYPVNMVNEWNGFKHEPIEETQHVGNITRSLQCREMGIDPLCSPTNKKVLEDMAEDLLVQKSLKIRRCELPGNPRSTFLMVFSPDGTKVASTHGNHYVYVSELATGKHIRKLRGHPRTPWCIDFHPSHPQLIGSGCLGGQVRVWDISSGGSEMWNVQSEMVIASIAFHPREQLLVIATYNELYFWDWSQPAPFTKVCTNNVNEKVRYVAFDALGYKLITGISLWGNSGMMGHRSTSQQTPPPTGPTNNPNNRGSPPDNPPPGNSRQEETEGQAQEMIVSSYHNLVQRYDSLVRNYQRLFMFRHRLSNNSLPPPNTTDRGTDPMETDFSPSDNRRTTTQNLAHSVDDTLDVFPSTSRQSRAEDGADMEESNSRILNLDLLSLHTSPTSEQGSSQSHNRTESSVFGSRPSAFQPLNEGARSFRVNRRNETTRLLPNPFSTALPPETSASNVSSPSTRDVKVTPGGSGAPRTTGLLTTESEPTPSGSGASRTSGLSTGEPVPGSSRTCGFRIRGRDQSPAASGASRTSGEPIPRRRSASLSNTRRANRADCGTQVNPNVPVDLTTRQTINESLDLIRDILRDSGMRLLNLITNMSLSTLANVERGSRRTRTESTNTGARSGPRLRLRMFSTANTAGSNNTNADRGSRRSRPDNLASGSRLCPRLRLRMLGASLPLGLLSSSSDSDSDHSLEVNILRTRNSTFQEDSMGLNEPGRNSENTLDDEVQDTERTTETPRLQPRSPTATERIMIELNALADEDHRDTLRGFNVASFDSQFRVRTQSSEPAEPSTSREEPRARRDQSPRPSTSNTNSFWSRGSTVPPDEALRKVRSGVIAMQKHTSVLSNMWLLGTRTSLRELRTLWENLRRRVLSLQRDAGRPDMSSYYSRSLLERCIMLTDSQVGAMRTASRTRPVRTDDPGPSGVMDRQPGNEATREGNNENSREVKDSQNVENETRNGETSSVRETRETRSPIARANSSPSMRRRLHARWRPEDEMRRRTRNPAAYRLSQTSSMRSRRDIARAIDISATRHEIRMRAMQVLSVMFNMMMMCLEERGLSQLIITMLRSLKKALALTCLMLMTNRNGNRAGNPAAQAQRVASLDVVRIQNVDHAGPVNVDTPEDSIPPGATCSGNEQQPLKTTKGKKLFVKSSVSRTIPNVQEEFLTPSSGVATQRWSNRLAVQIAAANRNDSATARNRRDLYNESKREKALHRTNPNAHPLIKKRVLPPVSTHRIPALRRIPSRPTPTPKQEQMANNEPVAGPSGLQQPVTDSNLDNSRAEAMNAFEQRVNLIRVAHMQAARLRNVARNRFRRLQTIRLYAPSSVREMFTIQSNNSDNPQGRRSPNASETSSRRFFTYRPLDLSTHRNDTDSNRIPDENPMNAAMLNHATVLRVSHLPPPDANANQEPAEIARIRVPRIHEYLQPIILAQNAMVIDDEHNDEGAGGGEGPLPEVGVSRMPGGFVFGPHRSRGMAGLSDAGIIPETLPVPVHRVQAWDFTSGKTPDIADSAKNIVVQRCKIHNDASIDISKDGRLLVALLPVARQLRHTNQWLGVYSLEWRRLGQCLHTAVLEQSAVSVALSPTARHLAVGLGSKRFTSLHSRTSVFALLYRLDPLESSSRTGLSPIKELEQNFEQSFTSLNCLRWAPQPGQGLVYANNTGQLIIMT